MEILTTVEIECDYGMKGDTNKWIKLDELIFDLEFKLGMTITIQDYIKYLKELKNG